MNTKPNTSTVNTLIFPLPDLELVKVEGHQEGQFFKMGGTDYDDEQPIHDVHIGYSFYMGRYQVTQGLYEKIMDNNPSRFQGNRRPVENVSWADAKIFIAELEEMKEVKEYKEQHGLSQYKFRLPTEAEWEYAARGGMKNQGYEYCGSDDLNQVGWYEDNSGGETKPVGLLLPNELGIYDMSGNVDEWCEDDWHDNYNSVNRPDDGSAWKDGSTAAERAANRVIRGGFYFYLAGYCRPAFRSCYSPADRLYYIGFRLVFSLQSK